MTELVTPPSVIAVGPESVVPNYCGAQDPTVAEAILDPRPPCGAREMVSGDVDQEREMPYRCRTRELLTACRRGNGEPNAR